MSAGAASTRGAHAQEVQSGKRFEFGKNWASFLRVLDETRIESARRSLATMLGTDDLRGRRFLDVGSGSGLSSLAAHRMGADVVSFDYDPASVACTTELRRRYGGDAARWSVQQGSALDQQFVRSLGQFDVVYSWGVLHHTGSMWQALDIVTGAAAPGGTLFIAIYNDQGAWSGRWTRIKRFYCSGPVGRTVVSAAFIPYWVVRNFAADLVWLRNPAARYIGYGRERGMSVVHDWSDWLGGYPFEVAKPEQILDFYLARGFALRRLTTCGGSVGCNEFVLTRVEPASTTRPRTLPAGPTF